MQNLKDSVKINHFLQAVTPIVVDLVQAILKSADWQIERKGEGLDTSFSIKAGDKETVFYLHNLLLEIASIDRDQNPMRFDERLRDFDYFIEKTIRLTESKLKILFQLFGSDDIEKAIENIEQTAGQYERIRILRFDQNSAK